MGKNGPLKQVLEEAKKVTDNPAIKGPVYELEKALELRAKGEKIVEFGKKIGQREFDIVTESKLIECKNMEWGKLSAKKSMLSVPLGLEKIIWDWKTRKGDTYLIKTKGLIEIMGVDVIGKRVIRVTI